MTQQPRIAMVAGETSGDLLASLLLGGMRGLWPDLRVFGIGGPQMARQGFDAWWPSERLAVHGYSFELLRRLAELAFGKSDLGLAVDVFVSFGLVALVIGAGLLPAAPAWALPLWNVAVVLNVLGAGVGRLLAAVVRSQSSSAA